MFYLYILGNGNKEFYIGYTKDLRTRVQQHNRKRKDLELIYYEAYQSEKLARLRERKLKYYGSAWRSLKKRIFA